MYYYEGSYLPIEWTNQHGCGQNSKTNCEIVLQYGCDATLAANGMPGLRDGTTTGCPNNGDQCPPLDNDEDGEYTFWDRTELFVRSGAGGDGAVPAVAEASGGTVAARAAVEGGAAALSGGPLLTVAVGAPACR